MSPSESSNLRHRHISLPLWGGAPDAIRYPGIGGGDVAAGVGFSQQVFVGVEVGDGAEWCARAILSTTLANSLANAPSEWVVAVAGNLGLAESIQMVVAVLVAAVFGLALDDVGDVVGVDVDTLKRVIARIVEF